MVTKSNSADGPRPPGQPGIAVIGMAGIFPDAANLDEFYANLAAGRDSVRDLPEERKHFSSLPPDGDYQPSAALDRIDLFDFRFFGLSRREAELMDPHQRIVLQLVHALIEDVAYLMRGGRAGLVDRDAKADRRQVIAVRGHAIPIRQVKDRRGAMRELLRHVRDHAQHGIEHWAVGHGDARDVEEFTAELRESLHSEPAFVVPLGPAVGTHAGPGALVVGFLERRPA